MGQAFSKQDLFINGLKESFKTRGTRVKKKDLKKFLDYIGDICPWFPQEGTIDERRWRRIGDCLNDYYQSFGPERVPVSAFSYWNLINDILKVYNNHPDIKSLITEGEKVLRLYSHPPSRAKTPSLCPVNIDLDPPTSGQNKDPVPLPIGSASPTKAPSTDPSINNTHNNKTQRSFPCLYTVLQLDPSPEALPLRMRPR